MTGQRTPPRNKALLNPYFWGGVRWGGVGWPAMKKVKSIKHQKVTLPLSPQLACFLPFPQEKNWHTPPKINGWNLEMVVSNRNLLFQGSIFRFHVCFGGCMIFLSLAFVYPYNYTEKFTATNFDHRSVEVWKKQRSPMSMFSQLLAVAKGGASLNPCQ